MIIFFFCSLVDVGEDVSLESPKQQHTYISTEYILNNCCYRETAAIRIIADNGECLTVFSWGYYFTS